MNKEENIRDRFSNFEPEVDDASIEMGWEKIKYFVPQKENKKRAGFFFLYGAAAIFILLGIATFLYFSNTKNDLVTSKEETEQIKSSVKKDITTTDDQTNTNTLNNSTQNTNSRIEINTTEKNNDAAQTNSKIIPEKQLSEENIRENIKEQTNTNSLNKSNIASTLQPSVISDSIAFQKLNTLSVFLLTEKKPAEINVALNTDYFFPKPVSLYSFDLFAGPQLSQASVRQNTMSENNSLGFLMGASLNYHLRNRFSFTGQFIFSKPNLNYTNTFSQNKIVSQSINVSSTPSTAGPDSIRYVAANTNYFINSKNSYHAALGLEYQFLKKKNISVNAAMLLDVRITQYDYGYTREFGNELLVYVKGTPNNPKDNLAPSSFIEENKTQSKDITSIGILPGAVVNYRLNTKTAIIFKPMYFMELTENQFIINSSAFKLKENNLMLNLGLRINL